METQQIRPNWQTRLKERVRTAFNGQKPSAIQHDQSGLTVTVFDADGSVTTTMVKWQDVNGAVAFKRDCYTVDQIRIGFTTEKGGIVVTEDMEGWEALIDLLPSYLPGTLDSADWWGKVAQPPFATNPTTLFPAR